MVISHGMCALECRLNSGCWPNLQCEFSSYGMSALECWIYNDRMNGEV